jgi:hypothetical protein
LDIVAKDEIPMEVADTPDTEAASSHPSNASSSLDLDLQMEEKALLKQEEVVNMAEDVIAKEPIEEPMVEDVEEVNLEEEIGLGGGELDFFSF